MATIDFNGDYPGDTGGDDPAQLPASPAPGQYGTQPLPRITEAGPTAPTTPAAPTGFGNATYDNIAGLYRNTSGGKYEPTLKDVSQWGTNVDAQYMNKIGGAIANWWKTQQPATPTAPTTPTGTAQAFITQWQKDHKASEGIGPLADALKAAGYTNVSRYMYGTVPSNNELSIDGQKYKVLGGEDSPATAYWYIPGTNDGGGAPTPLNPGGYTDDSSRLYMDQLMQRLVELRKPVEDPWQNILQLFALRRAGDLMDSAPYTAGEDAALVTHYRDPLTSARDAALLRNKERLSARGMAPTSGLLDVMNRQTEQDYEKGIASGSNDLAVRAVTEKQRRADESLQILSNLLNVNRSGVDRQNALYDQALSVAKMFPDFDEQRLNALLRASGEGPSSTGTMANLTSLASLGNNVNNTANANSQANAAAWGQILGAIFAAMNKK